MARFQSISEIDSGTFDELLNEYTDVVPSKLTKLDEQRYETIPHAVKKQKTNMSLSKEQVATLVDWKLSHGKFRPSLKGLVQQNVEQSVQEVTEEGFKAFSNSSDSAKTSLNVLTKLKGIGPAAASLLLSVYAPDRAPFFSDELFRWCFYEAGTRKGWDREIKYNLKEYLQLFEKVQDLRERLLAEYEYDVSAVDVEKVAYVLGKRAVGAAAAPNGTVGASSGTFKRKASSEDSVASERAASKVSKPAAEPAEIKASSAKPSASSNSGKRQTRKR